ncbi:MAG: ribonuclease III [Bacteroidales bacterium]|nr:ribonuclease III [Candidatus Colimorpha onthohippi]
MRWLGKRSEEDERLLRFFVNILGFRPRNLALYKTAFIHRSSAHEDFGGKRVNNERLEYLGDAVLGSIVAEYLYKKFPLEDEGFLTITRSKLVSRASLGKLGRKIGLHELIHYNHGAYGSYKSIDGDAFEALIGAIYLDRGYRFTKRIVVGKLLAEFVDIEELLQSQWNYKGMIIGWGQHNHKKVTFELLHTIAQSSDSRRQYECQVCVDGNPVACAIDFSIKAAEQLAAEKSYKILVEQGVIIEDE